MSRYVPSGPLNTTPLNSTKGISNTVPKVRLGVLNTTPLNSSIPIVGKKMSSTNPNIPVVVQLFVDWAVGSVIRKAKDPVATANLVITVAGDLQLMAQGQIMEAAQALDQTLKNSVTDPATIAEIQTAIMLVSKNLQAQYDILQGTGVQAIITNLMEAACQQAITLANQYLPPAPAPTPAPAGGYRVR